MNCTGRRVLISSFVAVDSETAPPHLCIDSVFVSLLNETQWRLWEFACVCHVTMTCTSFLPLLTPGLCPSLSLSFSYSLSLPLSHSLSLTLSPSFSFSHPVSPPSLSCSFSVSPIVAVLAWRLSRCSFQTTESARAGGSDEEQLASSVAAVCLPGA